MKDKYILFLDAKSPHSIKWLKELIKYFDIYIVSLNGYNKDILEYITEEKLFLLNDNVKNSGNNFKLVFRYFSFKKIVDKIQPKYINAHYLSSYGFIASLIKIQYPNIKLIQSTWGTDILVTPFKSKIRFYIAKFSLKNSDLITSDSYYMSDKINQIYLNNKIMTFPFGLDNFEISDNIIKDKFLIYSNRALTSNYNIDKIIIWFYNLNDKRYKLLIANDGDNKKSLIDLANKLDLSNRVDFIGFLDKDKQEINYKKAQFYISIPTSDSTAVSLLEAMRYGCYPIVSNLNANREWIINNINGNFFNDKMILPERIDTNIIKFNQQIIKTNAIFNKSIVNYVNRLEKL